MGKTRQEKIEEVVDGALIDVIDFANDLLGAENLDAQENAQLDQLGELIRDVLNKELDLELMVTVKYGVLEGNNIVTKTKRKTLVNALCVGFKIPENAVWVDVAVRPMVVVEGINGETVKKQFKVKFFNRTIYVENDMLTHEEVRQKLSMKDTDILDYSSDFADCSVLRFANVKVMSVDSPSVDELNGTISETIPTEQQGTVEETLEW